VSQQRPLSPYRKVSKFQDDCDAIAEVSTPSGLIDLETFLVVGAGVIAISADMSTCLWIKTMLCRYPEAVGWRRGECKKNDIGSFSNTAQEDVVNFGIMLGLPWKNRQ